MKKTIKLLAVLLGIQLMTAVGFGFSGQGLSVRIEPRPLITVVKDNIDRIILEGEDQARVVLDKRGDDWELIGETGFPADTKQVEQLLERLADLKSGTPVATTSGAQQRFKVNDNSFERRITLAQGTETLAKLYLGSSPGVRRILARAEGQDAIHSVKMAAYDVPVKNSGWEDKTILQVPKKDISVIEIGGLRLEQETPEDIPVVEKNSENQSDIIESKPPVWKAKGAQGNRDLKVGAADTLAELLAELRFDRVLGLEASVDYGMETPLLEVTLTRKGGGTLTYRLGKSPDTEEYALKVSSRPEYFRLAGYLAKPLIEAVALEQLLTTDSSDSNKSDDIPQTE